MSPFSTRFPESLYPAERKLLTDYNNKVSNGYKTASKKNVVICGICRDVSNILSKHGIPRIERLGSLFKNYHVVIYENDSKDNTPQILHDWMKSNFNVTAICETLNLPKQKQDTSYERASALSDCRNKYLKDIKQNWLSRVDYVIVIDPDITGGWSYDGIAHSFCKPDWDFVGSNSILYQQLEVEDEILYRRLYFDSWAYRELSHPEPHKMATINQLEFHRGRSLIKLRSCFGGVGIYRSECLSHVEYGATQHDSGLVDCDHPFLHNQMLDKGFDKIYLNPSQITLYSPTDYCV